MVSRLKWESVEADENFPHRKLRSLPNGDWEYGLTPMIFGIRIRLAKREAIGCVIDYCTGADLDQTYLWFGFITALLFMLPEDTSESEMATLFPKQTIKPLKEDKECQRGLFALAKTLRQQKR
jgi:hypothetical protein